MRVLFLTNFYLVQETGGEDQSCQQVVQGLKERGHTTLVLTSMHGSDNVPVETDGVYRSLYLEMDLVPWRHSLTFFTQRKAREQHNLRCLERVLKQFVPDIVFIWGMWNLPRSLAALAESRYPDNVVYRFATYWPTLPTQHEMYWRAPGRTWYSKLTKKVLGQVALTMLAREKNQRPILSFRHAMCVSATTHSKLIEAGIPIENARVIHTGIDAAKYLTSQYSQRSADENQTIHLLCAGRLVAEKGVDSAINAVKQLVIDQGIRNIKLSLAGSGSADYQDYLQGLVTDAGLGDYVSFLGHVPPNEMPQLLQTFDVLLVPSIWDEPFSRMVLEGMASGLVVVSTPRGGTVEILTDGENGLLFTPGDPDDLARKIARLVKDPMLRRNLAEVGRQTVSERFATTRMMDEIESYLQEVAHSSSDKISTQPGSMEDSIPSTLPMVSVVIPTYNRKDALREMLQSLVRQTYPVDRFEVIIVDDGSTDGTQEITADSFPFMLRYVRQSNQGDAAARNFGAQQSQADVLVFLDDDIWVEPEYLSGLIHAYGMDQNSIVVGTWDLWRTETAGLSHTSRTLLASGAYYAHPEFSEESSKRSDLVDTVAELPFRDIHSNNMALGREAYFRIGMMQPLEFSGSSMWCDLDFTYRAHRQGFKFFRSIKAVCWHRDHSAESLDDFKKRMKVAAYRSVTLFQKHPELLVHLPMFYDKTPIHWRQDSLQLIARKLVRTIVSARPIVWSLEKIVNALEKRHSASRMLPALYRYIVGGYIFQGYRQGLVEFGPVESKDKPVLMA